MYENFYIIYMPYYHLHVPIVKKSVGLKLLVACGPVQACNGTALPFYMASNCLPNISF